MKNFDEYETNGDCEYDVPVGETFTYKGLCLRVVQDHYEYSCRECFFDPKKGKDSCWDFACFAESRLDGKNVIFEQVNDDKNERD